MNRRELIAYIEEESLSIQEIQRQPYTLVEIGCYYKDKRHDGCGFSKVCHPDEWNAERGIALARQRAIGDIYQQIKAI